MKIAFVDPVGLDYSPLTPYERPLGGSQSGLCYLAAQLAANGNEVALVNNISVPGIYAGVHCPGAAAGLGSRFLNGFDVVVLRNLAEGRNVRAAGVTSKLVLWSGHAADQPAVAPLRTAAERATWDGFILISAWQARGYVADLGIDPADITILRNCVSPAFEAACRHTTPFFVSGDPPLLVYTSTPFRGLDVLLRAFPRIRSAIPGCRLRVFSSMAVYQVPQERDGFRALYDHCRALPGAEYVGSVSQRELAAALNEADMLAYPNTFPETACIAALEAMIAGCLLTTSQLGALPETTAGFGFLSEVPSDAAHHAEIFADMVVDIVRRSREQPARFTEHLDAQAAHARSAHTWPARSRQWEETLSLIIGGR